MLQKSVGRENNQSGLIYDNGAHKNPLKMNVTN